MKQAVVISSTGALYEFMNGSMKACELFVVIFLPISSSGLVVQSKVVEDASFSSGMFTLLERKLEARRISDERSFFIHTSMIAAPSILPFFSRIMFLFGKVRSKNGKEQLR